MSKISSAAALTSAEAERDRVSQNADLIQAQVGLANTQAEALANQSPYQQALTQAQTGLANETAGQVAPLAQSEVGLRGAQSGAIGAPQVKVPFSQIYNNLIDLGHPASPETYDTLNPTKPAQAPISSVSSGGGFSTVGRAGSSAPIGTTSSVAKPAFGGGFSAGPAQIDLSSLSPRQLEGLTPEQRAGATNSGGGLPGFSMGTSKVPGKGSPKVDSVKVKLAPGEAVLNAGAAEHMGRDLIDVLNAMGMRKMTGAQAFEPQQGMLKVPKE